MNATINGEQRDLADGMTLGELLRSLGLRRSGIAVAINERVVSNSRVDEHPLSDGDAIEIIVAVAGG
jgi:thiamine biosynthesis protein ThiS